MREHPIPQDVTGYRFHIVGSMTLKQFAEVFLGVIVAVVIYSTNLITPVKWALIVFSVALGAAAAFLPIEERPLDHWIYTFFRILYKPTQFFWRRTVKVPDPFLYKPDTNQQNLEPEVDLSPARRQRIKEYITSVNTPSEYISDFSELEAQRIQNILSVFETQPVLAAPTEENEPMTLVQKPQLEVRVRSLRASRLDQNRKQEVLVFHEPAIKKLDTIDAVVADDSPLPNLNFSSLGVDVHQAEETIIDYQARSRLAADQVAADVEIPENEPTEVEAQELAAENGAPGEIALSEEELAAEAQSKSDFLPNANVNREEIMAADAAFNDELPFPDPPKEPNKVVGMVLTPGNELITNAIAEIQTISGQIVRAVKTNALGQFFISTPLKNGDYVLIVEKPGFQFTPQHLKLTGKLVAPLEIRSL